MQVVFAMKPTSTVFADFEAPSVGRARRKCVFGHMRTVKAQIRLRIRAV